MRQGKQIFTAAMGVDSPWAVEDVRFSVEDEHLDLFADSSRRSRFPCPVCSQSCPVQDVQDKVRRHLMSFSMRPISMPGCHA